MAWNDSNTADLATYATIRFWLQSPYWSKSTVRIDHVDGHRQRGGDRGGGKFIHEKVDRGGQNRKAGGNPGEYRYWERLQ